MLIVGIVIAALVVAGLFAIGRLCLNARARKPARSAYAVGAAGLVAVTVGVSMLVAGTLAGAAEAPVGLGTAGSFAVLGGTGVTNTGPSVISGDLGSCPTEAITGFPPGQVINGTIHANDAVACGAQSDVTIAYDDAAGRAPTATFSGPTDLGGMTLTPGVYKSPTELAITGTLTLDSQGNPNSVFIFQAGSTLITSTDSQVVLIAPAQACNVFWQVGSSATLGVDSTFVGTILALTSIAANTDATVQGRLLARNGSTTLDSNVITRPVCATTTDTTEPTSDTTQPTTPTTEPTTPTTEATTPTPVASTPTTPAVPSAPIIVPAAATTPARAAVTRPSRNAAAAGAASATLGARGAAISGAAGSTPNAGPRPRLAVTGSSVQWKAFAGVLALMLGSGMIMLSGWRRPASRRWDD